MLIITDDFLSKSTHYQVLKESLEKAGIVYLLETNVKPNPRAEDCDAMAKIAIEEKVDAIIALGGGVVGDLSGFIASTYMRGIKFYNIPTTILSQVDYSIGGKTAIDFDHIKNIIGTFYQPHMVLIDPNTLNTLSPRQFNAGLVEAIKMACCFSKDLFNLIKTCSLEEHIEEIIYKSLEIKKYVVTKDVLESSLRKVLNFGHTIGHGIESYYEGKLLHGECVSLGMLYFSSDSVKEELKTIYKKLTML